MEKQSKESSPEWKRYRRLLRQYSKAVANHAFIGSRPPEEWPWITQDLRLARDGLDSFVTILLEKPNATNP